MEPARLPLPGPGGDCEHLHDATSRYDHASKRLELFLFCTVCRTAKLIHSLDYEPRFER